MRILTISMIFVIGFCLSCTTHNSSQPIQLRVNADSVSCESCQQVDISVTFRNDSDEDILVYNLATPSAGAVWGELNSLCDTRGAGTGLMFAVYKMDGTQEREEFEIVDSIGSRPVTKEVLQNAFSKMRKGFLTSGTVLKKHEERTLIKHLPLKNFRLQKGETYLLELAYYSGDVTAGIPEVQEAARTTAKLFQGCAMSGRIPLKFK